MRAAVFVGIGLGLTLGAAAIVATLLSTRYAVLALMGAGVLGIALGLIEGAYRRRQERS